MEVTLGCGTFAKVSNGNFIFAFDPVLVAGTGGLGHLGAKRGRHGANVKVLRSVMNRHLLAFPKVKSVAYQLVGHLLDTESSPQEGSSLAVLREH